MAAHSRREVLEGALATAALTGCAPAPREGIAVPSLKPTGTKPRNVVLILTDDQRFDSFSFMGHPFLRTPRIDQLVREGAWCRNAFVTTSLCCPSRASMLTGRYAHDHGVLNNQSELAESELTYAQYLSKAGLPTAYVGKWHMGADNPHPRPGWQRWIGFRGQGRYTYPGPRKLNPLDRGFSYNGALKQVKGYVTDLLTDEAVSQLAELAKQPDPFCLVLAHKACHAPFVAPPRHRKAFSEAEAPPVLPNTDEAYATLPHYLRALRETSFGVERPYGTFPDFTTWYRAYHRTLLAVDESVGRILDTLEQTGAAENTAVLYTSDNGFMHGEKGALDKRNAYETSIRIPMLIRAPGLVEPGRAFDELVLNLDLAPTILDLMGLTPPHHMHGRSLRSLFVPVEGEPPWRERFLYEYFHERLFPTTPTVIALRTRQEKLITYHGVPDPPELYNLDADPGEMNNLATAPGGRKRAQQLLVELQETANAAGLLTDPVWGQQRLKTGTSPP